MDLHSNHHSNSFLPPCRSIPHDHIHSHHSTTHSSIPHPAPSPITIGSTPGHSFTKEKQFTLPEVGQTRCYWALLTTSLQFTVLDPVLKYHLREQAPSILNCGLLDFVHPDERESAERDLGNVLAEKALHGSVTRVRYCRLSRVRRLLGWSDNALPYPPTFPAERIAVDADYMAVYLVVNCVADGIVLCFIHAVVDIAPQADNDERRRTGWSNWCSTYGFDQDIPQFAHALYQRLCDITPAIPRDHADPSLRVLQILQNQADRLLIVSWPPDSTLAQDGYLISVGKSLAHLAQQVQLGYSAGNEDGDDARTSCTRRYKSVQTISVPTVLGSKTLQVESILIPHGTIIFACHKVCNVYLDLSHTYPPTTNCQDVRCPDSGFQSAEGLRNHDFLLNSIPAPAQQDLASHSYVQQWVDQQLQDHEHQGNGSWENSKNMPPHVSSSTNDQNECDPGTLRNDWQDGSLPAEKCSSVPTVTEAQSPATNMASSGDSPGTVPPSTTNVIFHVNARKSCSPSRDIEAPVTASRARFPRDRVTSHGRGQGTPPAGVSSCAHCQIAHSPEWRKGPSGKKDLCNACGLRFSRSRAKTEGIASRKRKNKEKVSHPLSKTSRPLANVPSTAVRESSPSRNHQSEIQVPAPQSHLTTESWPGTIMGAGSLPFPQSPHNVQAPFFS